MRTIKKCPKDSMRISVDEIISDTLKYLGNLSDFFQVLMEKNADELPDVFAQIVPELERQRKRLAGFQRRRAAQVKGNQELRIPAKAGRLFDAVSGHEWFQKSYWGRSIGLRTLSREESIGIAIKTIILGVVYIHHVPVGCPRGFRTWMSGFHASICTYLTEFRDNQ